MSQRPLSVLVKGTGVSDPITDRAISEVRDVVRALPKGVLDGAQLLEDVVLTSTSFARIAHRLGRKPTGYTLVSCHAAPSAAFSIYDDNANRTDTDKFMYLRTVGANVTVTLAVF